MMQASAVSVPRQGRERCPIAILSYDRPHYLEQVLQSLRPQVDRQDHILLFQDGGQNAYGAQRNADPEAIAACVRLFRTILPWGTVMPSPLNLGIAGNYERAEQEIFARLQAPCGLFLEDDMVLSPNYLGVIDTLLDLAKAEPRISYVSAYGNFWAPAEAQLARPRELIHMHENWGFAMTREAWLDERPFRQAYLRLLEGGDYTERNAEAIMQFYRNRGWTTTVTSQDGARWIASLELGKVRVTTFPCHARYIGRVGVHFTEQLYDQGRFASAIFFPGRPQRPDPPTDAQIGAWLDVERRRFTTGELPFYHGHAAGTP